MREEEFELSVGDMLKIGDHIVTVIDIDGAETSFRIDKSETQEFNLEPAERVLRPH